ncbi:MAG: iron-containing alcohol dehydrogenase [bacterium]|nr:iron-containing alcohol dehydrogenase [bacterium]
MLVSLLDAIACSTAQASLPTRPQPACQHAPTPDARAKMCRASHLAGKAINISKTTLPHAMSYAITADYGVPHGQAVAMLLAAALQFNADIDASDCLDPRGVEQVRNRIARVQNVLGAANVGEACQLIREFVRSLGCSASPAEAGIESNEAFARIATKVNVVRLGNNPRKTTPAILAQLLAE